MSLYEKIKLKNKSKGLNRKKKPNDFKTVSTKKNLNVNTFEKNQKSVEIYNRERILPQVEVVSLTYKVMEEETLRRLSVCEVNKINKNSDLTNTTDDTRLGTIENSTICPTCHKTNEECPGHLGILKLPVSFIHPYFRLVVVKILQSVCNECSSLLLSEKHIKESGIYQSQGYTRLNKIAEYSTKLCCELGHEKNPVFKPLKSGSNETRNMFCTKKISKKEIPIILSVEKIKKILDNISNNDAELLGFNKTHPRNFIVDFVPIIPLSARPYVYNSNNEPKSDYITNAYGDILSRKIESFQEDLDLEETDVKKDECYDKILYLYDHLIQNSDQTFRRSPTDVCKSISDRIVGKDALVRGHIMGKRANFTGRTVLGPNRSLCFGEIAPPKMMMNKLTVPERATIYNMEYLKELSKSGKIDYICPARGSLAGRKLKFDPNKHFISLGDKIGRFSDDGDVILFNRQPTLHKQSMLGYVCKFQDKLSVGIHISSTTGHNADFDGDEGNLHMLQTTLSQIEGRFLMSPGRNLMLSQNSGPVTGLILNGLSGAFMMSEDNLILSEELFYEGVKIVTEMSNNTDVQVNMNTLEKRLKLYPKIKRFSGKHLCSILFPEDFDYTVYLDSGKRTFIRFGILSEGRLTDKELGSVTNSIIQSLWKKYGMEKAVNFITNGNFLFNWFCKIKGLTVSIRDCYPEKLKEFLEYRRKKTEETNREVMSFLPLQKDASNLDKEIRENEILKTIKKLEEDIKKEYIENYTPSDSSLEIMTESGAKGSKSKTILLCASMGQQLVNNQRPKKLSTNGTRWLNTFSPKDNSIYSRGFCENSFFSGLNPNELFAQAQASRVGLIDTAIKTSDTGALERRMVKAQEDLVVRYDGTVRNYSKIITQFTYGAGYNSGNMTNSFSSFGTRIRSFINIRDMIIKINTENGYPDYNLSNEIISIFNRYNQKYGDETISEMHEGLIDIKDLAPNQESLSFQEGDETLDMTEELED